MVIQYDAGSGLYTGGFMIHGQDGQFLRGASGWWTWMPNSTGGVLTMNYLNAGFHSKVHYGIAWLDANTIMLTDYITAIGPVRVVLQR
jgi:hypothetical protein